MVITLIPTVRAVNRRLRTAHAMALATALLTIAVLVVGLGSVATLYAGVIIMSLGHAIFMPIMNGAASRLSPPGLIASYSGINGMALAIGGLIGSRWR